MKFGRVVAAAVMVSTAVAVVAAPTKASAAISDLVVTSSISFGDVDLGTQMQQNIMLTNPTSATVVFNGESVLPLPGEPFNAGLADIANPCSPMLPGEVCHIATAFLNPRLVAHLGQRQSTIRLTLSNTIAGDAFAFFIPVSANVQAPFTLSPPSVDFGQVPVGLDGTDTIITVTNTSPPGTEPVTTDMAGGAVQAPFALFTACAGKTLAPGQSCQLFTEYHPRTINDLGLRTTSSNFTLHGRQYMLPLQGTGVSPTVPAGVEFGGVPFPGSPAVQTVNLVNDATVPIGPLTVQLSGVSPPVFALTTDGCGGLTLQPGATCPLSFTFTPAGFGDVLGSGQLTVFAGAIPGLEFQPNLGVQSALAFHGLARPGGPPNLHTRNVSSTSIGLQWNFPTRERRWIVTDEGISRTTVTPSRVGTRYRTTRTRLAPGSAHCFVVSTNLGAARGGETLPSPRACAVTKVSSLSARAVDHDTVKLRFRGRRDLSYSVIGPNGRVNGFTALADGSRSAIFVHGLPARTRVCFRVIGVSHNAESPVSARVCTRTKSL
jgi:hypothetical protein